MLRNILAATLRNLMRNRVHATISITGIAVGICTAVLMGLVIRNQLTYDRFIRGYERTYLAVSRVQPPGVSPLNYPLVNQATPMLIGLEFPEIEAFTRLADEVVTLRRDQVSAQERIYWADANAFDILPLPVLAGDLETALRAPDGIVLTHAMARTFFGKDAPLQEIIQVNGQPMTVKAIIQDLPANGTHLQTGIFASALSAHASDKIRPVSEADLSQFVAARNGGQFSIDVRAYFRLTPAASIENVQGRMPAFLERTHPPFPGMRASTEFVRLDRIHGFEGFNPGLNARLAMVGTIATLILLVAMVNFVNLWVARSARRALEVGIRKTAGAARGALVLQFVGESLVYVAAGTLLGVALTELSLPYVNAFLNTGAVLQLRDLITIGAAALALAVLAGAYPAFVVAGFRPLAALRGWIAYSSAAAVLRQSLVTVQFAVLIGLIVAAVIVYRQRDYAMHDALRLDTDQVLMVRLFTPDAGIIGRCEGALRAELAALAGVRAIGCASLGLLDGMAFGNVWLSDGRNLPMDMVNVEPGVFEVFGVTPLAGRIPVAEGLAEGTAIGRVVNETAARRLGYAAPGDAIGQLIQFPPPGVGSDGEPPAEIVAVVPDFSLTSVEQEIDPTIYRVVRNPRALNLINIRLTGQEVPETIAGIDRVWESTGALQPIDRFFLDDHIQNLYLAVLRQAQFFSIFSGIAVALACLGLVGLASSTTERRTKEIGIRKATGASSADILRLLNWEFAKPVLWANLIAWPVAYYAMQRWLEGFAYHIDLELWMFAAAGASALVIALATVSAHSWLVARAKPVTALRYE